MSDDTTIDALGYPLAGSKEPPAQDTEPSTTKPTRKGLNDSGRKLGQVLKSLLGILPPSADAGPTESEIEALYRRPPNFNRFMPYKRYDPETGCFAFRDNVSVGALFELRPIDAEARPEEVVERFAEQVTVALGNLPQRVERPWVVQFFLQDEPLAALELTLDHYLDQFGEESEFRDHYRAVMREHFDLVARPTGLFEDAGAGVRWSGRYRRIRVTLYRNFAGNAARRSASRRESWPNALGQMPWDELNDVARRLRAGLEAAGLSVRRATGRDLFEWLLPWFNPQPEGYDDAYHLLREIEHPSDAERAGTLPEGFDLALHCARVYPESSSPRDGIWKFGGRLQRMVSIGYLNHHPRPGHFTLSTSQGRGRTALFDRLPPESVFTLTLTADPQDRIQTDLAHLIDRSRGSEAGAAETAATAKEAQFGMTRGHALYRVVAGVILRADSKEQLNQRASETIALLTANELPVVQPTPGQDVVGLDAYAQALPFAYKPKADKQQIRRGQLAWLENIAALAPVYGQTTGSGRPGMVFFNRSGEPMMFDPLNPADRDRVPHSLIFGATGAGKSAMMVYQLYQAMAVHRPHLYIVDVGDSYRLLGEHLKRFGLTTHYVRFTTDANLSIPPFAEAATMLEREAAGEVEGADDERRDYMSEMETAAKLMCTGADPTKEVSQVRAGILRHGIKLAALGKQHETDKLKRQVMVDDLVDALRSLGEGAQIPGTERSLQEDLRRQAGEMAEEIGFFTSGLEAKFFNRPADSWPDVDVTIIDLGILGTSESYRSALAITFAALMSYLNSVIEARRFSGRTTLVAMDEVHVATQIPSVISLLVKAVKMWRRWGGALWLATQNVDDFHDDAAKVLANCEWWYLMGLTQAEIDQVDQRFRNLSDEERALLGAARKDPGKFVEGVLLKDRDAKLFRNVPPALCLALAQSNPDERAARSRLMQEHNCTELEAVYRIADEITQRRLTA